MNFLLYDIQSNSFWKHKISDSNPMVSLETLLKKMLFDLMVTIPVRDAMTLSQDPIAVFTNSFSITVFQDALPFSLLTINHLLRGFYWVKLCVAEIWGKKLGRKVMFYIWIKRVFFPEFLKIFKTLFNNRRFYLKCQETPKLTVYVKHS